jgi:pilus assembly protein Flp/PilA
MSKFISAVKAFAADENGVTAIEYGLIAALVGVGISVAAQGLGTNLSALFTQIGTKLTGATAP